MQTVKNVWEQIKDEFDSYFNSEKKEKEQEIEELEEEIQKAHEQWKDAQNYFENVAEPDLIDHASYKIEAARTKYMYLLKKAKNEKNNEGGK